MAATDASVRCCVFALRSASAAEKKTGVAKSQQKSRLASFRTSFRPFHPFPRFLFEPLRQLVEWLRVEAATVR